MSVFALSTPESARQAQEALRTLRDVKTHERDANLIQVTAGGGTTKISVTVPREAFELFIQALVEIANGNAVTLMPMSAELTTQQAAELLNVSRPFLVKLLDEQGIPYRMVGTHRRIRAEDILRYRHVTQARSKKALAELAELAQEHDLGY